MSWRSCVLFPLEEEEDNNEEEEKLRVRTSVNRVVGVQRMGPPPQGPKEFLFQFVIQPRVAQVRSGITMAQLHT